MSEFPKIILRECECSDLEDVSAILRESIPHMTGPEMIVVCAPKSLHPRKYFIRRNKASLLIHKETPCEPSP